MKGKKYAFETERIMTVVWCQYTTYYIHVTKVTNHIFYFKCGVQFHL